MKKRFSQIFLVNKNAAREMVEKMNLKEGEFVLEIGPGRGILTEILLQKKIKVIAVEIDRNLCKYLEGKILDLDFNLIEGDFLKIKTEDILKKFNLKKIKVISNVPYHITTPILEKLIEERKFFSEIYLTLQKEVVERIKAKPGTKEYSSLTIFVNYYMDIEILIPLPSHFFYPKPKVNSLFFRMIPKEKLRLEKEKEEIFFKIVRRVFQERRKKLGKILKELGLYEKVSEEIKEKRPDQISLDEYIKILK